MCLSCGPCRLPYAACAPHQQLQRGVAVRCVLHVCVHDVGGVDDGAMKMLTVSNAWIQAASPRVHAESLPVRGTIRQRRTVSIVWIEAACWRTVCHQSTEWQRVKPAMVLHLRVTRQPVWCATWCSIEHCVYNAAMQMHSSQHDNIPVQQQYAMGYETCCSDAATEGDRALVLLCATHHVAT